MSIPISSWQPFGTPTTLEKLQELRIATLEQLASRITLASDRQNMERFLGVSLDDVVKHPGLVLAGAPRYPAAYGALIPAGTAASTPGAMLAGAGGGGGGFPMTPGLPSGIDLSARFGLAVRDQGDLRLTCVAFATCAAAEFAGGATSYLSPQSLYWDCKARDVGPSQSQCGTFVATAIAGLPSGLVDETGWSYNLAPTRCPDDQGPPPPTAVRHPVAARGSTLRAGDLVAIKTALAHGHPVIASVLVFPWWTMADYPSGTITSPLPGDSSLDAHAICLVGYDDLADGSGDGDLLFRNSWGIAFGATATGGRRDGYGRLGYRYIVGYPAGQTFNLELAEMH